MKLRRVVAEVEWRPGELRPRVGFVVTNMAQPAERVVSFYNMRGACEQWSKEAKGAINGAILPTPRNKSFATCGAEPASFFLEDCY